MLKIYIKQLLEVCIQTLYNDLTLDTERFYASYVATYIEKDVSQLINLKDKYKFEEFMEILASSTGIELIYDNLAKIIGVSV